MDRSYVVIYAILLLATSLVFAELSQSSGSNQVSASGGTSVAPSALATVAVTKPVFRDVNEGAVVGMTSWNANDTTQPLLKTNYFHTLSAPWGNVRYVWPKLTGFISNDPYGPRACFAMKYYDTNKKEIPEIANTICVGAYDSGFVIEVLKLYSVDQNQGRALITAPLIP